MRNLGFILPYSVFALAIVIMAVPELSDFRRSISEENAAFELVTFAAFLAAAIWSVWLAYQARFQNRDLLVVGFFAAFALGAFFVAGEEVAWGQWMFFFDTPSYWREINVQNELTVHNIEGLQGKTEVFRLVFGLAGLIGLALRYVPRLCTIAPPVALASWFLLITAFAAGELLTDFVTLPVHIVHGGLRANFFSEYQELVIGGVALLYLWHTTRRLNVTAQVQATAVQTQ